MSDFFNGWPEDGEPMTTDTQRLIERLRDAGQQINALANESGWTIADEAADALEAMQEKQSMTRESLQHHMKMCRDYEARVAELEDRLFASGEMSRAPCFCCGYNGPSYYQPSVHPCAKRHHAVFQQGDNDE